MEREEILFSWVPVLNLCLQSCTFWLLPLIYPIRYLPAWIRIHWSSECGSNLVLNADPIWSGSTTLLRTYKKLQNHACRSRNTDGVVLQTVPFWGYNIHSWEALSGWAVPSCCQAHHHLRSSRGRATGRAAPIPPVPPLRSGWPLSWPAQPR